LRPNGVEDVKATFQAESLTSPDPSERPQLAVKHKFLSDHRNIVSKCDENVRIAGDIDIG